MSQATSVVFNKYRSLIINEYEDANDAFIKSFQFVKPTEPINWADAIEDEDDKVFILSQSPDPFLDHRRQSSYQPR